MTRYIFHPITSRLARIPGKVGAAFASGLASFARSIGTAAAQPTVILAACASLTIGGVAACNLPPATVKSLTSAGVTLACSIASASVPAADRNLTATICQDAEVIAPDVLASIWEAAAAEHRASGLAPAAVQPQGDAPLRAVQCAGRNVMAVPAATWALAQTRADKVRGCRP